MHNEKEKNMLYKSVEEALNRRQLLNTLPTVMTYSKAVGMMFDKNACRTERRENQN